MENKKYIIFFPLWSTLVIHEIMNANIKLIIMLNYYCNISTRLLITKKYDDYKMMIMKITWLQFHHQSFTQAIQEICQQMQVTTRFSRLYCFKSCEKKVKTYLHDYMMIMKITWLQD
jgi:hypothetical protein